MRFYGLYWSDLSRKCGDSNVRNLDASRSRVLLILGDEAGEMIEQLLELDRTRVSHRSVMCDSELRCVLFVPAPGSSMTRDIGKIHNSSDLDTLRDRLNGS